MFPNTMEFDLKGILEERVLTFIQTHQMILPSQTLLVGVSGGADSVCLLHLLASLRENLGVQLHVAHLDHMLRGDESREDAEYVSSLSSQLGLPVTIGREDVRAYQQRCRLSLEEAAREVRYGFFAHLARSMRASGVAVAHTADDQAETILMHLLRGSGAQGLRGIRPLASWRSGQSDRLTVVRPLLEVSRKETEAYCGEHGLTPRQDSSNRLDSCLRNRVRHKLIPQLWSYNPDIGAVLLHTSQAMAEIHSFMEDQVSQRWGEVVDEQEGTLILRLPELCRFHPALQRYLLRGVMRHLLGDLEDIGWKHIESMRKALTLATGKQVSLPRGLTLTIGYGEAIVGASSSILTPPILEEMELKVPGHTELPEWAVEATLLHQAQQGAGSFEDAVASRPGASLVSVAYFDAAAAGDKLVVRGRRPGDRFQPLGMSHPKKLQDFMVDVRIPRIQRGAVPLVCSPQHILWVVGWRIDERVKISENTRHVMRLEFKRADSYQRREQYEAAN